MHLGMPLFDLLKSETTNLHREIEGCVPFLKTQLEHADYRQHLLRLLGFYEPLETAIATFVGRHGDAFAIAERSKSGWLCEDLCRLDMPLEALASAPRCQGIKGVDTPAALVGILYVTEGSTLGGQIIRRILKTKLGLEDSHMRFYRGYDEQTLDYWHGFRIKASEIIPEPEYTVATERAKDTFAVLMAWLKGDGEPVFNSGADLMVEQLAVNTTIGLLAHQTSI